MQEVKVKKERLMKSGDRIRTTTTKTATLLSPNDFRKTLKRAQANDMDWN